MDQAAKNIDAFDAAARGRRGHRRRRIGYRNEEIEAVAAALNGRPRKTLGWKTPAEALNGQLALTNQAGVASTG